MKKKVLIHLSMDFHSGAKLTFLVSKRNPQRHIHFGKSNFDVRLWENHFCRPQSLGLRCCLLAV